MQAALDPQAYAAQAGGRPPISLALPGSSPIPLLEYIADSTTFRGVVLMETLPLFAFDGSRRPEERARELIARFENHRVSPARLSEDWLQVYGLSHFVFRAPALLPARFAITIAGRSWPKPNRLQMRPDRFGPASVGGADPEASQGNAGENFPIARHSGRPATDAELAAFEARIERAVGQIQGRGGQVVSSTSPPGVSGARLKNSASRGRDTGTRSRRERAPSRSPLRTIQSSQPTDPRTVRTWTTRTRQGTPRRWGASCARSSRGGLRRLL